MVRRPPRFTRTGHTLSRHDALPISCLFLIGLPNPAVRVERLLDTIDSSMPGGHAVVAIDQLRVPQHHMLGASGEGFRYAQVRLSPARLSHCMRWLDRKSTRLNSSH